MSANRQQVTQNEGKRRSKPGSHSGTRLQRQPELFEQMPQSTEALTGLSATASNDQDGAASTMDAAAHLRAAKRLSKAIRAQKANRVQQKATGIAICEHLLALLEANEAAAQPDSQ